MAVSTQGRHLSLTAEREMLASLAGIHAEDLSFAHQKHSDDIRYVKTPGLAGKCDCLITDRRYLVLSITVADCVPVFLYAPDSRSAGLVHAGWRGTAKDISGKTVAKMESLFGARPNLLRVFMGPSIGPCCYEVGSDVAGQFPEQFLHVQEENHLMLDLPAVNRFQLTSRGVEPGNIDQDGRCTFCDTAGFQSYRRLGSSAGRMLCVMGLI